MATELIKNIYLVNAPAGSGKTTKIRKMVEEHLCEYPQDNILCITYTNRAAEELGKNIDSRNVFFGTIHSYINSFLKSFFSHKEIVDLYWEEYGEAIATRIENSGQDQHINESNQRYREKYGDLSVEEIKKNIKSISYTEAPFNSLYTGGLGHDDLITFTRKVTERFPIVRRKIADKFQVVFIDEYQDTNADVLRIFYDAMQDSSGVMYLLGDKMQQIYDNYDGSFEKEFSLMQPLNLEINYRATPKLISILNNIYNDERYSQRPFEGNSNDQMDYNPEVIITSNVDAVIRSKQERFSDILVLYLLNSRRFEDIGAENIYNSVRNIDDYKFGGKYGVVEVLTTNDETNPDRLFLMLFLLSTINELYTLEKYGKLLRFIKRNKKSFNYEQCRIMHHEDKENVKNVLDKVIDCYNSEVTIKEMLVRIKMFDFMNEERIDEVLEDSKYEDVLNVPMHEFRALSDYLHVQNISTQHGVKGESHDSVLFVADDSNQPSVNISEFFKYWCKHELTLTRLAAFSYDYSKMITEIEHKVGSKIDKSIYQHSASELEDIIKDFENRNKEDEIFVALCKEHWDAYFMKPGVTSFKNVIKKTRIKSVLMAYKLLYVGCSRARKNLTVLIDKNKVNDFLPYLEAKLKTVGFDVIVE